jgi:hypothetical protein
MSESNTTPQRKPSFPKSGTRQFREYFAPTSDNDTELLKDNIVRGAVVTIAAVTAGPAVAAGTGVYFAVKGVSEKLAYNARTRQVADDIQPEG